MSEVRELWHRYGCMLIGTSDLLLIRNNGRDVPPTFDCCDGPLHGRRWMCPGIEPTLLPTMVDRTTPPHVIHIVHPVSLVFHEMLLCEAAFYYQQVLDEVPRHRVDEQTSNRRLNLVFAAIDARLDRRHLTEHLDDGDELFREAWMERQESRW